MKSLTQTVLYQKITQTIHSNRSKIVWFIFSWLFQKKYYDYFCVFACVFVRPLQHTSVLERTTKKKNSIFGRWKWNYVIIRKTFVVCLFICFCCRLLSVVHACAWIDLIDWHDRYLKKINISSSYWMRVIPNVIAQTTHAHTHTYAYLQNLYHKIK